MGKAELRDEISALTKKYVGLGGVIEVLPEVQVLGMNHSWMKPYGWDYLPWCLMGVAEYGHFLNSNNSVSVGEGCYITYATPTED